LDEGRRKVKWVKQDKFEGGLHRKKKGNKSLRGTEKNSIIKPA